MALTWVFLLACVYLARGLDVDEKLDTVDTQMNDLTYRLIELRKDLASRINDNQAADDEAFCFDNKLDGDYGNGCPGEGSVRCRPGNKCVPNVLVCDGRRDCLDGADERNCEGAEEKLKKRIEETSNKLKSMIKSNMDADSNAEDLNLKLDRIFGNGCEGKKFRTFRCGNSAQCVPSILVCDGTADCNNAADETHCESWFSSNERYIGGCQYYKCDFKPVDRLHADRWEFKKIDWDPNFPGEETITWDFFAPPGGGTIAAKEGSVSSGTTYNLLGTGRMESFYSGDKIGLWSSCQGFQGSRILRCEGWRAGMFGVGDPCYVCTYRKRGSVTNTAQHVPWE